jgi:hypothetical protein
MSRRDIFAAGSAPCFRREKHVIQHGFSRLSQPMQNQKLKGIKYSYALAYAAKALVLYESRKILELNYLLCSDFFQHRL